MKFVGYEREEAEGEGRRDREGRAARRSARCRARRPSLVTDVTPFYGEAGGQVGDRGVIERARREPMRFEVRDTQKPIPGLVAHDGHGRRRAASPWATSCTSRSTTRCARRRGATTRRRTSSTGRCARCSASRRRRRARSSAPDRLRFDFAHGKALTREEIARIEDLVNAKVLTDAPGPDRGAPHRRGAQARRRGDLRGEVRRRRPRAHDDEGLGRALRRHARARRSARSASSRS